MSKRRYEDYENVSADVIRKAYKEIQSMEDSHQMKNHHMTMKH